MEHTPGPWRAVEQEEEGPSGVWSHWTVRPQHLEQGFTRDIASLGLSSPIIEANARLVAAAPELLEEFRALLSYVQCDLIPSVREVVGGQALLDKGWDKVREGHILVAKATS